MTTTYTEYQGTTRELKDLMRISEAAGWGVYDTPDQYESYVETLKATDQMRLFLAKENETTISFLEVFEKPQTGWDVSEESIYVNGVATDAHAQGQQLTHKFCRAIMGVFRDAGFRTAITDVQWDNHASQKMCKRLGGQIVSDAPEAVQYMRGEKHVRIEIALD